MWDDLNLWIEVLQEFAEHGRFLREATIAPRMHEGEVWSGVSFTIAEPDPAKLTAHHQRWNAIHRHRLREEKLKKPRACLACGKDITLRRSDAKCCGRTCKNHYRRRTR